MLIKERIIEFIKDDKLKQAIDALLKIAPSREIFDFVTLISSRFNNVEHEERNRIIRYDDRSVSQNRVRYDLLSCAHMLPSDSKELLIEKLKMIVWHESGDVHEVIVFLLEILQTPYQLEVRNIMSFFDDNSEWNFNLIDTEKTNRDTVNNVKEKLSDTIGRIENYHLVNDWQKLFWDYCMNNRISYVDYKQVFKRNFEASKYFDDLKSDNKETTQQLLLWQEEFLIGNYEEALKYINNIRLKLETDSSRTYEYLLLTYYNLNNKLGLDKSVRKYITTEDRSALNRIFLYIERVQELENPSSTINESLKFIYQETLSVIQKFYHKVSFDYVLNKSTRGISKKRELIKETILLSISFFKKIKNECTGHHQIYEDLMIELMGGGKYTWIKVNRDGEIENSSTFGAVEKFDDLKEIFRQNNKHIRDVKDYLYDELTAKVKNLDKAADFEKAREKLLKSCLIGFKTYNDIEFKRLLKLIGKPTKIQDIKQKESTNLFNNTIRFNQEQELLMNEYYQEVIRDVSSQNKKYEEVFMINIESITVHFKFFHQCFFEGRN